MYFDENFEKTALTKRQFLSYMQFTLQNVLS